MLCVALFCAALVTMRLTRDQKHGQEALGRMVILIGVMVCGYIMQGVLLSLAVFNQETSWKFYVFGVAVPNAIVCGALLTVAFRTFLLSRDRRPVEQADAEKRLLDLDSEMAKESSIPQAYDL